MTTKAEVAVAVAAAAPRMSFWPSFGDISTKYCSAARLEFHVPGLAIAQWERFSCGFGRVRSTCLCAMCEPLKD